VEIVGRTLARQEIDASYGLLLIEQFVQKLLSVSEICALETREGFGEIDKTSPTGQH